MFIGEKMTFTCTPTCGHLYKAAAATFGGPDDDFRIVFAPIKRTPKL